MMRYQGAVRVLLHSWTQAQYLPSLANLFELNAVTMGGTCQHTTSWCGNRVISLASRVHKSEAGFENSLPVLGGD
jgi:hypothetical protein